VVALFVTMPLSAQIGPQGSSVVEVGLALRQVDGVKRVLMIGAHPDDEDSSLLATLARGMGAETAYLSLTRGDGGQNSIGPELGESLGIIRTGELEAARELDGGRQFFTRAFDYGFSKSAAEAFAHWPREEVLRDVVSVIRTFRPQVIISVWAGTPRDGHGQHQASGILANEAFDAAARRCWARSPATLVNRKDSIRGLAVASDVRIEAYLLFEERRLLALGCADEDRREVWLGLLLRQFGGADPRPALFERAHPGEVPFELLRSCGFEPSTRSPGYVTEPTPG